MDEHSERFDILNRNLTSFCTGHNLSRRRFLMISGISIAGISILAPYLAGADTAPMIIIDNAEGIVIADPTRCVGCRRCELACTEFNDGKAHPYISRIKISRNLNYGPKGVYSGKDAKGNWGNGLIVQDLCKQCPHPVPCANVCPNDAIVAIAPLNARMVDIERCTGCKLCLHACPWEMMSFDPDTNKATKCFLCNGKPKCVEACPASALSYEPWSDLTGKVPYRTAPTAVIPAGKAASCTDCH